MVTTGALAPGALRDRSGTPQLNSAAPNSSALRVCPAQCCPPRPLRPGARPGEGRRHPDGGRGFRRRGEGEGGSGVRVGRRRRRPFEWRAPPRWRRCRAHQARPAGEPRRKGPAGVFASEPPKGPSPVDTNLRNEGVRPVTAV
ncbi:MAG TPA: hypothetical protein DCQ30_07140 [Acidimicrobiaceae bacterium]|nr:hypothetical protein [Acidimicrobiaceae bacterium]